MTKMWYEYAVFVRSCHIRKTNHWPYNLRTLPVFEQLNKYSKHSTNVLQSELVLHWLLIWMLYILHGALNFMVSARLFYLLYLSVILSLQIFFPVFALSFSFFTSFFLCLFLSLFCPHISLYWCQASSVRVEVRLRAGRPINHGLILGRGKIYTPSSQLPDWTWTHPSSCQTDMRSRGFFLEGKVVGAWRWQFTSI
jgi:hypothetical protein